MGADSEHHNSHQGNHTNNQHTGDHTKTPATQPLKPSTPAAPLKPKPSTPAAATAAAAAATTPQAAAAIARTAPAAAKTGLPGAAAKVAEVHAAAAASTGLHPSVVAALGGVLLGMLVCIGTCIVCRIYRRTRYYKKVQHSLEEEERAFQASLSLKYGEGGEPSSLDQADKERLQMVENYLDSVGDGLSGDGTEQRGAKDAPTKVEDVEAFMEELAAAAAGNSTNEEHQTSRI
jgi:hypothetical protein